MMYTYSFYAWLWLVGSSCVAENPAVHVGGLPSQLGDSTTICAIMCRGTDRGSTVKADSTNFESLDFATTLPDAQARIEAIYNGRSFFSQHYRLVAPTSGDRTFLGVDGAENDCSIAISLHITKSNVGTNFGNRYECPAGTAMEIRYLRAAARIGNQITVEGGDVVQRPGVGCIDGFHQPACPDTELNFVIVDSDVVEYQTNTTIGCIDESSSACRSICYVDIFGPSSSGCHDGTSTCDQTQSPVDTTLSPTRIPTLFPIRMPTLSPTNMPTSKPTLSPTSMQTLSPTRMPTLSPTIPTSMPTLSPTRMLTVATAQPTAPTTEATKLPTPFPASNPVPVPPPPSREPSPQPIAVPIVAPSNTSFPIGVVVGVTIGSAVFLALAGIGLYWYCAARNRRPPSPSPPSNIEMISSGPEFKDQTRGTINQVRDKNTGQVPVVETPAVALVEAIQVSDPPVTVSPPDP